MHGAKGPSSGGGEGSTPYRGIPKACQVEYSLSVPLLRVRSRAKATFIRLTNHPKSHPRYNAHDYVAGGKSEDGGSRDQGARASFTRRALYVSGVRIPTCSKRGHAFVTSACLHVLRVRVTPQTLRKLAASANCCWHCPEPPPS